ncbi:hypothetical protein AMTR_s00053p00018870 [Amborella trichopoda]|uniref:Uncharacterized protein n=1 Tax=Amborella trichopoda TaxID=13333 RepID=W1PAN5_AMBTC|nr:hypothetical protein AMTR_s00053p00018870 [Amborella trichopoda]
MGIRPHHPCVPSTLFVPTDRSLPSRPVGSRPSPEEDGLQPVTIEQPTKPTFSHAVTSGIKHNDPTPAPLPSGKTPAPSPFLPCIISTPTEESKQHAQKLSTCLVARFYPKCNDVRGIERWGKAHLGGTQPHL